MEYAQDLFYLPAQITVSKIEWALMSEPERAAVIFTDAYNISPYTDRIEELLKSPDGMQRFLELQGINFPTGAGIYSSNGISAVIMMNTKENHIKLQEFLEQEPRKN